MVSFLGAPLCAFVSVERVGVGEWGGLVVSSQLALFLFTVTGCENRTPIITNIKSSELVVV